MKYKDFVKSTGYGTGEDLYGWNCRHTFIPFNPEILTLPTRKTIENKAKKTDNQ